MGHPYIFTVSAPLMDCLNTVHHCYVWYAIKKKNAFISPHQSATGNVAETHCERINSSADPCQNLHNV